MLATSDRPIETIENPRLPTMNSESGDMQNRCAHARRKAKPRRDEKRLPPENIPDR